MADLPRNNPLMHVRGAIGEGRYNDALSLLQQIEESQPGNPEVYNLAGQCLLQLGDLNAALDAFQRAATSKADWPAPYLGAAEVLARRGDAHGSMRTLLHVLDFAPEHDEAVRQLVDLLARLQPDQYLSALEPALRQVFAHPEIDPTPLTGLCGQQLLLSIADEVADEGAPIPANVIERIADNRLWQLYLSRVININPRLEKVLTQLRRQLCMNVEVEAGATAPVSVIAALAQQCYLNEYVFDLTAEETVRLEEIDAFLNQAHEASESVALAFALGCLYRPPGFDSTSRALAHSLSSNYAWLEGLCRLTVFEPHEEGQVAETLATLRIPHRESSLDVQAHYETHPYPRWTAPPAPEPVELLRSVRRRFSLRADTEPVPASGTRCLVAGCGTGFEPVDIARRDISVKVTALDLSRRSLAYARRHAKALGCENIDFVHGDILDLSETDGEFDLIICTGVLHHMADPLEGWRILRDELTDTGMMRIGLYSAYARRAVKKARELLAEQGLVATPGDVRRARQQLLRAGSDPDLSALPGSDDFYSMSGCRDLLFHPREHQFTLPEIGAALDDLGLRFCGFDPSNIALLDAFSARFPGADALLDLSAWDLYEQANPDSFAGMYQFWCEPK